MRIALALSVCGVSCVLAACPPPPVVDGDDAGPIGSADDAGTLSDAGPLTDGGTGDAGLPSDAGSSTDAGSTTDAGNASDAGSVVDAGPPFTWSDLVDAIWGDAGLPEELECLPEEIPELSLAGALDYLSFEIYTGSSENGVRCGDQVCPLGTPCCALCGYSACADPGVDGGAATCPFVTRSYACDGREDCPNDPASDTCCYTLDGTTCRAEADCTFELPSFGGDAGFFPWPPQNDGGFIDDTDAGATDGGFVDGGAPIDVDAGPSPVDAFLDLLDQGLPVCRNLLDCGLFSGDLCCTSERIVELDLGVCISALACLGGALE